MTMEKITNNFFFFSQFPVYLKNVGKKDPHRRVWKERKVRDFSYNNYYGFVLQSLLFPYSCGFTMRWCLKKMGFQEKITIAHNDGCIMLRPIRKLYKKEKRILEPSSQTRSHSSGLFPYIMLIFSICSCLLFAFCLHLCHWHRPCM